MGAWLAVLLGGVPKSAGAASVSCSVSLSHNLAAGGWQTLIPGVGRGTTRACSLDTRKLTRQRRSRLEAEGGGHGSLGRAAGLGCGPLLWDPCPLCIEFNLFKRPKLNK